MKTLIVDRREDMSPDGYLRLFMQEDGDIIVSCVQGGDDYGSSSVEFCTPFTGGGRSPRVRNALMLLMWAMKKENEDHPRGCAEFDGSNINFLNPARLAKEVIQDEHSSD